MLIGTVTVIDKSPNINGAKPNTVRPEREDYTTLVTVRIIELKGLAISKEWQNPQRAYGGKKGREKKWKWSLKPTGQTGAPVSFRFQVDVLWKAKVQGMPDVPHNNVWPNGPFKSVTGKPAWMVNGSLFEFSLLWHGRARRRPRWKKAQGFSGRRG